MTGHVEETVEAAAVEPVLLGPATDIAGGVGAVMAARLVEEARATGVDLVGPDGLLADLTKRVLSLASTSR